MWWRLRMNIHNRNEHMAQLLGASQESCVAAVGCNAVGFLKQFPLNTTNRSFPLLELMSPLDATRQNCQRRWRFIAPWVASTWLVWVPSSATKGETLAEWLTTRCTTSLRML